MNRDEQRPWYGTPISRRTALRMGAVFGLSTGLVPLLAACGGGAESSELTGMAIGPYGLGLVRAGEATIAPKWRRSFFPSSGGFQWRGQVRATSC